MATPLAGRPNPTRREPLWDRVDRNRFRLLVYLAVFAAVTSVFNGVVVAMAAFILLVFSGGSGPVADLARLVVANGVGVPWALGAAVSVAYEAWSINRSERWLLKRLGAITVPTGQLLDTKLVLKDMAIASGQDVAPALYVLNTPNVNAFAFRGARRRPVVGVTLGLVDRLTLDEQRAVFANLCARIASGDIRVSSAVAALLAPLNAYRTHRLRASYDEDRILFPRENAKPEEREAAMASAGPAFLAYLFVALPLVFFGELVAAAQRRSQLVAAEKADAEGMLLLKDPRSMLSALERMVRCNNNVLAADDTFGDLFWSWTADSSDDETDPEWARLARLREVLGVDGWVPDDEPAVDVAPSFAPCPPRLETAEREHLP